MKSEFWIWRSNYEPDYCVVGQPANVPKGFELSRGISRAQSWPADLVCRMREEYPTDTRLPDSCFGSAWVIVSPAVRKILESAADSPVEYLTVGIANHNNETVASDFSVVNPLAVIDAIDIQKSEVNWNPIRKDLISRCKSLEIDPAKVPENLEIFRLRHLEHTVIVRSQIAEKLIAARLVGLALQSPASYSGG